MASTTLPGGTFKLADDLILTRMGYGAMQLAGPHVSGHQKITTARSQSCARSLGSESVTSTPATSVGRISPIN